MKRFALTLGFLVASCTRVHVWPSVTPRAPDPKPVRYTELADEVKWPRNECFTTKYETKVVTLANVPCPEQWQIEFWTKEAARRVDGIRFEGQRIPIKPDIAYDITLVVTPFQIDCDAGDPVNGCSWKGDAFVHVRHLQYTWPHELGHFIVERTGMSSGGDVDHALCGFWFRLVDRECGDKSWHHGTGWDAR